MIAEPPPNVARFFDSVAIEANRAGRLAPSQASRLRRTVALRVIGYVVSGALAFMLYLVRAEATGTAGLVLGVVVLALLALAVVVVKILPPLADLLAGRVEAVSGAVSKATWINSGGMSRSRRYELRVGEHAFSLGANPFGAVRDDAPVTAYFLPRTGDLLTLEQPPA